MKPRRVLAVCSSLVLALILVLLPAVPAAADDQPIYREETQTDTEYYHVYVGTPAERGRATESQIVQERTERMSRSCRARSGDVVGTTHSTRFTDRQYRLLDLTPLADNYLVTVRVTCRFRDRVAESRRDERRREERQEDRREAAQAAAAVERRQQFCTNAVMEDGVLVCTEHGGATSRWKFTGAVVNSDTRSVSSGACPRSRKNGELLSCDFGPRGMQMFARAAWTAPPSNNRAVADADSGPIPGAWRAEGACLADASVLVCGDTGPLASGAR